MPPMGRPPSDDPYRLNNRTSSYGLDMGRDNQNLMTSGNFGALLEGQD